MATTTITVEQVQEILDDITFAARYKPEEGTKAIDNADIFLKALLSPEVITDPIAYKLLQHLATFLKDGLLEKNSQVFETVDEMYSLSNSSDFSPEAKTTIQELASGLFSHACSALQGNANLTVNNIKYLLKAMAREGGNRWNAYACCGPLLMTQLEAFQPHAPLLLEVMLSFPETLTVIHELYQLAPVAFVENMELLVKLYESNCNGQLSILDIVRDLAKLHPYLVTTHLATLNRIAQGANNEDVAVVKEIEKTCANSTPAGATVAEAPVKERREDEPKDFDEKVAWLNSAAEKCRDLASLREFLKNNKQAQIYLEDVDKVMPIPSGIDYCIYPSEAQLKSSGGSGSKANSPSLKATRDSIRTSRDSLRASKDLKNMLDKDAKRRRSSSSALGACFGQEGYELQDFIMLRFTCAAAGPQCATRVNPIFIRANIPPPWLKLATVLFARSPPAEPLRIQIKKYNNRGDTLDALQEIAQSVEMAAAAKSATGIKTVDGFEVLSCPFLDTDDLGDLIVDLRTDGLFNTFHFNPGSGMWACSACSTSNAQKAKLSGYLIKKGRRLGIDVKRFYMLDDTHFFYASTDRAAKAKRKIPMFDILSVNQLPENCLEILLKNSSRTVVLRAPSEQQAQRWVVALQDTLAHSKEAASN